MPQRPDVKLRIEAASYRGRPVSFKVVGPWTRPALMEWERPSVRQRVVSAVGTLIVLALLAGALLLVRANLDAGRADRRGAPDRVFPSRHLDRRVGTGRAPLIRRGG